MYSTYNKGISAVAERFIKIYMINQYMTPISKKVYINKGVDAVNEYNDTYHREIKIKPVDVK